MGIVLLEENILRFWAYFQIGEREAYLFTFNDKYTIKYYLQGLLQLGWQLQVSII